LVFYYCFINLQNFFSFPIRSEPRDEKSFELLTFRFIKIAATRENRCAMFVFRLRVFPQKSFRLPKPMKLDLSIKKFFEGKFYTKKPPKSRTPERILPSSRPTLGVSGTGTIAVESRKEKKSFLHKSFLSCLRQGFGFETAS
jgi:hypothetical protein